MSDVYFLTWGLSLLSSGLIMAVLMWFKRRERSAKAAPVVSVERKTVTSGSPEYRGSRGGRLDRAPFYICMMWSLFVGALIMLIGGPIHPSTIDAMDPLVQRAMSFVLCIGTGTCIFGSIRGNRYFMPHADLRDCYRMAVIATPANVATLSVYALAVGNTCHWNLRPFGLGAGGILAILVAHLLMAWDLHQETKRLDERVAAALRAAMNEARDDDQTNH